MPSLPQNVAAPEGAPDQLANILRRYLAGQNIFKPGPPEFSSPILEDILSGAVKNPPGFSTSTISLGKHKALSDARSSVPASQVNSAGDQQMPNFDNLLQLVRETFQNPQAQAQPGPQGLPQGPSLQDMLAQAPDAAQQFGQQLSGMYSTPPTEQTVLQGLKDMFDPNKSQIYRKLLELWNKAKK